MTRSETIKRNKLIADFMYSNYQVSRYFCNSYSTCNTVKFAVFQDYDTIDVVKLIKFLDKNKIKYSEAKKINSYGYTSVIIRFEK